MKICIPCDPFEPITCASHRGYRVIALEERTEGPLILRAIPLLSALPDIAARIDACDRGNQEAEAALQMARDILICHIDAALKSEPEAIGAATSGA